MERWLGIYVFLAVMSFFLVRYTSKNKPGEHMYDELRKYRSCGIVMLTKYRKYNSQVYSAAKAISLASVCVSMLTLETTMLITFVESTMSLTVRRNFRKLYRQNK